MAAIGAEAETTRTVDPVMDFSSNDIRRSSGYHVRYPVPWTKCGRHDPAGPRLVTVPRGAKRHRSGYEEGGGMDVEVVLRPIDDARWSAFVAGHRGALPF